MSTHKATPAVVRIKILLVRVEYTAERGGCMYVCNREKKGECMCLILDKKKEKQKKLLIVIGVGVKTSS